MADSKVALAGPAEARRRGPIQATVHQISSLSTGSSRMSLKKKRMCFRLGLHSAILTFLMIIILIGALVENASTAGFFAILFAGYLVTLRVNPLPGLLEKRFLLTLECSACGETIDLMSNWSCGCGFTTWDVRHALSPCPVCKREFEWLQCPSCENGMQT